MRTSEKITERASDAGVSLSAGSIDGLTTYLELLRQWNRKVSLTALPVEELGNEAIDRLLIEPILATEYLDKSTRTVLDVGSGSGSPAIPIKLVCPGISLLMVESKSRKSAFLREAVRALGLEQAEVATARYRELIDEPAVSGRMDVVTVRAVRIDREALSELRSFLRPEGFLFHFTAEGADALELSDSGLMPYSNHPLLRTWGSRVQIVRRA